MTTETLDLKAIREEAEHAAIRSDPAGRLSAHVLALVDEVERLRTELEAEHRVALDNWNWSQSAEQRAKDAESEVERLRAENEALRVEGKRLRSYAEHVVGCAANIGRSCNCGFAALSPSRDGSPTGNWQDDENRRKGLPDLPSRDGSP